MGIFYSVVGHITQAITGAKEAAKTAVAFALNILGLSDAYGNIGTFTRAGAANVMDYTGTLVSVPTDVHRVTGGHKVENLVSFSEDMTSGVWPKVRNATASAPDTLNFTPAVADVWGQYDVVYQSFIGYQGQETLFTFTVKGVAGETVYIFVGKDGGPGIYRTITLTPQWKTYASRVGAQVLAAPTWGPTLYIVRPLVGTVTTMQIKNIIVTDVTGKPANYIPPYVQRLTAATAVEWFDNESGLVADANGVVTGTNAGNPLHPKSIINGQSTYLDVRKYATATVVPAGGSMEDAGRWYTSALGGTTAGATLLADVGVTDWVDKGLYNPGFGLLLEGGTTNLFINPTVPATQTVTLAAIGIYTVSVRGTGVLAVVAGTATGTGFAVASEALPVTINVTAAGSIVCTLTGVLSTIQLELNGLPTSFVNGIRQNELGNLKFPTNVGWAGTNAFPHAAGTMLLSMVMPMDLMARGKTNAGIVDTSAGLGLLHRGWAQSMSSTDGVTYSSVWLLANYYIAGDTMQFAVTWDAALSHFRLSYRNATTGLVWTHAPWVAYKGSFSDTGMYKFFASSTEGGTVRNNIILNKALTDIEIQGYVIP